jgi:hypothetical protein
MPHSGKDKFMSSAFIVSQCVYDGTSGGLGDSNPLCLITGQVNGLRVFPRVFFEYLMAASSAGQMQQALTAVLFNWYAGVYGYQFTPWPTPIPVPSFPASGVTAQQVQGPFPQPPVSVSQALIGTWTA